MPKKNTHKQAFFSYIRSYHSFLFFLLFFVASFIFFQSNFWYNDNTFFIKGKQWSDFAAHIPLIRSFSIGNNFPPEYPMFAGEKITYHFLFYFLVGVMEKLGVHIAIALNVLSALGFSFLLLMIFLLGKHFFSLRAGIIAVILFLLNGSFTFVEYFKKYPLEQFPFWQTVTAQKNFVSFGPWDDGVISAFWNLNIFTNQRHLALGIALFLLLVFVCERKIQQKKYIFSGKEKLFFFGALSLLPLLHQASYAAFVVYGTILFLRLWNQVPWKTWAFLLFCGGVSLAVYRVLESSFTPIFDWGFLVKEKTLKGFTEYWLFNFGLYSFFFPFLLWKSPAVYKNILFTGAILCVISFIFRFSPDMINNHKFITLFLVVMNIGIAGLLDATYRSKQLWKKIGVVCTFFFLTFSGFIDIFPILNDSVLVQKDYNRSELGRWAATTDTKSTFFVNDYLYNPVSLAGRKLYLDYGYFAWSMGYPDKERRENIPLFFEPDIAKEGWCTLVKTERIDYFVLNMKNTQFLKDYSVTDSALLRFAPAQTYDEAIHVFDVKEICP